MANIIIKEYYPYPGYDHYYQVTNNMFDLPKTKHKKTYSTEEVDAMIKDVISKINNSKSVVSESVSFESLPNPSQDIVGVIYNITNGFITDNRFLEGSGKHYSAGSNVIVVFNNGNYLYDVLAGDIEKAPESDITDIIDDIYPDD